MSSPPHLNLACTVACWPLSTRSHSTLFWPYFLLIIMWIIKVQVHETHINHLQWTHIVPGLSHCSWHELRPKYSLCKLSISLPPTEYMVTCLSLKTYNLQGSQQAKGPFPPQPSQGPLSTLAFHWPRIGVTWADDMLFVLKIPLASFGHSCCGLSIGLMLILKSTIQNY